MSVNQILDAPIVINNSSGNSVFDIGNAQEINIRQSMKQIYTGTLDSVTETTAIIEQTVEPNWVIEINTGSGHGQRRRILSQTGFKITVQNWQIKPDNGADYTLYNDSTAVFIYRQVDGKFYLGTSPDPNNVNEFNINPAVLVAGGIETPAESVYYVGKHGSDSATGRTMSTARLTFGSVPTNATVICLDSGIYPEVANVKNLYAPNAKIQQLNVNGSCVTVNFVHMISATGDLSYLNFMKCDIIAATAELNILGGELGEFYTNEYAVANLQILSGQVECMGNVFIKCVHVTADPISIGSDFVLLATDITTPTPLNVIWADAKRIHNHIQNLNNPHQVNLSQISPLNTKGDILGYSTEHIRVASGMDGQVLRADSTVASGLSWYTIPGGATDTPINQVLFSNCRIEDKNFNKIYDFLWIDSFYNVYNLMVLYFSSNANFKMRVTGNYGTYIDQTILAGIQSIAIPKPLGDEVFSIFVAMDSVISDIVNLGVRLCL